MTASLPALLLRVPLAPPPAYWFVLRLDERQAFCLN